MNSSGGHHVNFSGHQMNSNVHHANSIGHQTNFEKPALANYKVPEVKTMTPFDSIVTSAKFNAIDDNVSEYPTSVATGSKVGIGGSITASNRDVREPDRVRDLEEQLELMSHKVEIQNRLIKRMTKRQQQEEREFRKQEKGRK